MNHKRYKTKEKKIINHNNTELSNKDIQKIIKKKKSKQKNKIEK